MTLGEFGPDIKKALESESDLILTRPSRSMISLPPGIVDPGTLTPRGTGETEADFNLRGQLHRADVDAYQQAVEQQRFDRNISNQSNLTRAHIMENR